MTTVTAIQCPKCQDIIYSRARHDYRSCTCQSVSIDGGFDYIKTSWDPDIPATDLIRIIEVNATTSDLYKDWSQDINEYGLIKKRS